MEFEKRFLKPYIEPVKASELQEGIVYYTIDCPDNEMVVPNIITVVYI